MIDVPFTNPFRYSPHPLVRKAAREVMERLDSMISSGLLSDEVARGFTEGKMLGVLVCRSEDKSTERHSEERSDVGISTLAAFSGNVGGQSHIEGFVPPIFDLMEEGGYYRTHEAEITAVNKEIEEMGLLEKEPLELRLKESRVNMEVEISMLKTKKKECSSIAESQFANGEIKRAKDRWKNTISELETQLSEVRDRIKSLKRLRAGKSDKLQRWIFEQYIVHNAAGEKASILDIFQKQGLMPPGGTGDCAAPKLLNYAYTHGLKPIAMGEFWYGKSPATAVRTHGHFYPSCTSKCGPLLSYMMQGMDVSGYGMFQGPPPASQAPPSRGWHVLSTFPYPETSATSGNICNISLNAAVIYEDEEIVVACKPSGMPSVPGLDGRESLQEWLQKELQIPVISVHRLDMDTSGVIVFAKNSHAEISLKKQFEEHTVKKTYMARLSPADTHRFAGDVPLLKAGDKGIIDLSLGPDYDERPRQKVDPTQGKESLTEYEVVSVNEDGSTDILFHPHTGRTHQLRVHSAHLRGLGRPILGDLLYGGCGTVWTETSECSGNPACTRLHLHAHSITFLHPTTGKTLTFSTPLASEA